MRLYTFSRPFLHPPPLIIIDDVASYISKTSNAESAFCEAWFGEMCLYI